MEVPPPANGGAKRRRRPSVRLGEIGSHHRPTAMPGKLPNLEDPSMATRLPHRSEDEGYRDYGEPGESSSPIEAPDRDRSIEDGSVRAWLNRLGLGRYVPVFQIHEVDEEVLPFLTLDDLKEMGISAVGSRRKIFFAIQQLGKSVP
ncbi:uncharacterized protein LOC144711064 [Wolffia australiana]